jgi:hypothetical protein
VTLLFLGVDAVPDVPTELVVVKVAVIPVAFK